MRTLARSAVGLAFVPAVASGFSRFAYGLVLPDMRADLGWSYATAGAVNTASSAGFLAGSLGAAAVVGRAGERRTLAWSMGGATVTVLGSGITGDLAVLAALRVVAGVAAGVALVVGAALVARLAQDVPPRRAALLLGAYFAGGGGAGMVVPGIVVPTVLDAAGWRLAWVALGVMSAAGFVVAVRGARAVPAPIDPEPRPGLLRWPVRTLCPLLIGYGLYGAGYIAYMTFIVAYLDANGATGTQVAAFWVVLGLAAVAGTYAWSPVLARLRGGRGPALTLVAVLAGALLPLVSGSLATAYASAVIFGGSFLAAPSAIAGCAREILPQRHWTSALAALIGTFALGQCAGPVLAGAVSDGPSGVRSGLLSGAALLAAAIGVTVIQRREASWQ